MSKKRCYNCNKEIICSLKLRIVRLHAYLTGHITKPSQSTDGASPPITLHDWLHSFAEICKHYSRKEK